MLYEYYKNKTGRYLITYQFTTSTQQQGRLKCDKSRDIGNQTKH